MKAMHSQNRARAQKKSLWIVLVLCAFAIFVHHLRMDASLLNPRVDSWLWQTDWAIEYIGWLYFRYQDWSWPPGFLPNYLYPLGASIGTTDSIPLAAYFFKILAPILGEPFEYFSWWYLLSILLAGLLSYKILRAETRSRNYSFIGALFFMVAPPLMGRNHHMALSAQWILILGLGLYTKLVKKDYTKQYTLYWIIGFIISSSLHPYLWAMYITISAAVVFQTRNLKIALYFILGFVLSISCLWLHGYFKIGDPSNGGFGYYSADLLSYFHPHDLPVILPNLPRGEGQYEGYSYFGLGTILLLLFVISKKLYSKEKFFSKSYFSLFFVCFLMWIFALATPITFAGRPILKLDFLYEHLKIISNTFRSSGRFVWPFYYGILFWVLIEFFKFFKPQRAQLLLAIVFVVHFFDVWRIVDYPRSPDIQYNESGLNTFREFSSSKDVEHLVIVYSDEKDLCPSRSFHWEGWYYYPLIATAAKNKWTVNIGSASRFSWNKFSENCVHTMTQLREGKLSPRTLYAFKPEAYYLYINATHSLECTHLVDAHFCYSK